MSDSPRPQFFVARADGTITPLIAVDELPVAIQIKGVPAAISPADTQNMTSLGLKERSNQRYTVLWTAESPSTKAVATTALLNNGPVNVEPVCSPDIATATSRAQTPITYKGNEKTIVEGGALAKAGEPDHGPISQNVDSWRKQIQVDVQADGSRPAIATDTDNLGEEVASAEKDSKSSHEDLSNDNLPSKAAYGGMGTRGTLGKKVYCTHWIRWGECDYTQQGCLYKHEMPDEQKLQEIGIATYPRWYRIANPEKFKGDTDGPVWHRRPGPAPTDQLWRGPQPTRPVEPQTYEDFRSNARPAPSSASVNRQPFGHRTNQASGPIILAFDPSGNGFQTLGNFGFQSNYNHQPRQQFNRTPVPRVVNMQPPFARQQRPELTGPWKTSKERLDIHTSQDGPASANAPGAAQRESQVVEITEETSTSRQPGHALHSSSATQDNQAGAESRSSQLKAMLSRPAINGNGAQEEAQAGTSQSSPTTTSFHPGNANGNYTSNDYGSRAPPYGQTRGRQDFDEAFKPLIPSTMPRQFGSAENGNINGSTMSNHFVPPPPTPPTLHKRYFVPPGQSKYAANSDGSLGEKMTNGKSSPNGGNRKNANSLVDL